MVPSPDNPPSSGQSPLLVAPLGGVSPGEPLPDPTVADHWTWRDDVVGEVVDAIVLEEGEDDVHACLLACLACLLARSLSRFLVCSLACLLALGSLASRTVRAALRKGWCPVDSEMWASRLAGAGMWVEISGLVGVTPSFTLTKGGGGAGGGVVCRLCLLPREIPPARLLLLLIPTSCCLFCWYLRRCSGLLAAKLGRCADPRIAESS